METVPIFQAQSQSPFPTGINNPISLLGNDKNPLGATSEVIAALNANQFLNQYVGYEFLSHTGSTAITEKDVAHRLDFVMANTMIAAKAPRLLESTFGFLTSAAMTEEPIKGDNFSTTYIYEVDVTDAASEAFPTQAGPIVNMVRVVRKVVPPTSLVVSFKVAKSLHTEFSLAVKAFAGAWLADPREKQALGLPLTNDLDNPRLFIARDRFEKFKTHIQVKLGAAARSLARGECTKLLNIITFLSPSVYSIPKSPSFTGVKDRKEIARMLNSSYGEMLFAINKLVPVAGSERVTPSDTLNQMMQLFKMYTDNTAVQPDMQAYLSGPEAPFVKPDVVVTTTSAVIDKLLSVGVAKMATATLNQYMTVLSLGQQDMSPLVNTAPQASVYIEGASFKRDMNRQMAKQLVSTPDQKIYYGKLGNSYNVLYVPIDTGSFAKTAAEDAQYNTMTMYDTMMPCGVTMCEAGQVPVGPSRQSVSFVNENGVSYSMGCELMKKHLLDFFTDDRNAVWDKRSAEYALDDTEKQEKSLVFYRARNKTDGDDDDDDESGEGSSGEKEGGEKTEDESKSKRGGGSGTSSKSKKGRRSSSADEYGAEGEGEENFYYRNKYVTDNIYYTSTRMCNNIITLLENEAAPGLRDLVELMAGVDPGDDDAGGMKDEPETDPITAMCAKRINAFNMKTIVAVVTDYMNRKKTPVSEERVKRAYWVLYYMTNEDAVQYLKYLNMGFGIIWTLPKYAKAASMGFNRPGVFSHFGGLPTTSRKQDLSDESNFFNYTTEGYSTVARMSLTNPAIFWRHSTMISTQAASTNKMAPVIDQTKQQTAINWLAAMRHAGTKEKSMITPECANGWWALICQPDMDKSFFESPNSPVGRLATHYSRQEEFEGKFPDQRHPDVKYPNVFTMNTVFFNVKDNFNTLFMYSKRRFMDEDFPFTKYMNYNPAASAAVSDMEDAISRTSNPNLAMQRDDAQPLEPMNMKHCSISETLGAALPKCSWTSSNLSDKLLVREDMRRASSYRTTDVICHGTGFFITGVAALDKFDRCRVSHDSFIR